jgi:hypothetical protein
MRTRSVRPINSSEKSLHLVRCLGSRKAEERRLAQQELRRLAAEDPALFHADLADIIPAIIGTKQRACTGGLLLIALLYPVLTFALLQLPVHTGNMQFVYAAVGIYLLFPPLAACTLGLFQAIHGRRRRRLAECIRDIDALEALPALIELMDITSPGLRSIIAPSVTRLLLRLRASDAYLLGYFHRSALIRRLGALRTGRLPAEFYVATLHALEQIGDSQSLSTVAWLAQGKGPAHHQPLIREAAQRCLIGLQEQMRRHQAPYLLLRPSSAEEAAQDLLRPVVHASASPPEEMLRAVDTLHRQAYRGTSRAHADANDLLPIRLQKDETA